MICLQILHYFERKSDGSKYLVQKERAHGHTGRAFELLRDASMSNEHSKLSFADVKLRVTGRHLKLIITVIPRVVVENKLSLPRLFQAPPSPEKRIITGNKEVAAETL